MSLPQRHELPELPPPFFWSDDLQLSVFREYKTKPRKLITITSFPVHVVGFMEPEDENVGPVAVLRQYTPHDEPTVIRVPLIPQSSFARRTETARMDYQRIYPS